MKKFVLLMFTIVSLFFGQAQAYDNQIRNNPVMKTMRSSLKNSGNERIARNLLVVKAVADFKVGDEKYAKEFETVENTREFQKKIEKIMSALTNTQMRNYKNKEVVNILNDAGDKLYNLLAN